MRYPTAARENGIEGTVIVQFFVEKNGRVADCQIVQGPGYGCDEEAVRLIQTGPKWKKRRYLKKILRYQIPFRLED